MLRNFAKTGLILLLILSINATVMAADLTVSIPDVSGSGTVTIPVNVKNAKNIGSMDIVITYDPAVLKVTDVEKGDMVKGLLSSNTEKAGIIAIGIVDSKGITGDGEIAVMSFEVIGSGSTPLTIESVKAYDVDSHIDVKTVTESGTFTVSAEKKETEKKEEESPGFEFVFGIAAILFVLRVLRK